MSEEKKPSRWRWSVLVAKLAKLAKLFKFGKFLLVFGSMALSIVVYSFMLGPWFAAGFVLLLFIHEMGHIVALRMRGYDTPGPVFIPMLGAVIAAPKFLSADDEAFVGFAGPLAGGLAAIGTWGLWIATGRKSEILLLVGFTATYLNIFNLIPLRPLDGGRVMQVAGRWSRWVGGTVLLAITILWREPAMLYIWIIVLGDIKLKPFIRFGTSVACWVAMATLMSLGFSHQNMAINVFDCTFTLILLSVYYSRWKNENSEYTAEVDHPVLPLPARLRWVGMYAAIVVVLGYAMMTQYRYLPSRALPSAPHQTIGIIHGTGGN